MSSANFDATIDLAPRPSMRALKLLFFLHVIPVALLPFAIEPGTPLVLLVAAIGLSWFWLRRHAVLGFGKSALVRLVWHGDGAWTVTDGGGARLKARLLPNSIVHPRMLLLNFRSETGLRRSRLLLGDELEPEALRRLRARLYAQGAQRDA